MTPLLGPTDALHLADSSVGVALIQESHELHAAAFEATRGLRLGMSGHAWFETFSVLTRLPAGQRRAPHEVVRAMRRAFPETRFLGPQSAASLSLELADLGISGGSVHDALVAATAREHGSPLLTGDRRARTTYDALGVQVRWIGSP